MADQYTNRITLPQRTASGLCVRFADWTGDAMRIRTVREKVFIQEQGVPRHLEWDGHDVTALFLLAISSEGSAVGTVRLLPTGQIGRMAVLPDWRRMGAGTLMTLRLVRLVPPKCRSRLWLNAQRQAVQFYFRLGFHAVGDEFLEADISHQRMIFGRRGT